jgi:hypothetical protein
MLNRPERMFACFCYRQSISHNPFYDMLAARKKKAQKTNAHHHHHCKS